MIDFETLGNTPNTAVISMGVVIFNRQEIISERIWYFNLEEQLRCHAEISSETVAWWIKQGSKAKAVFDKAQARGISPRQFALEFVEMLGPKPDIRVWGNGATFDVSIVESILRRTGHNPPWKFWNIRCYRTLKQMFGIEAGMERLGTKHDALDDARFQAQCLQEFLRKNEEADR